MNYLPIGCPNTRSSKDNSCSMCWSNGWTLKWWFCNPVESIRSLDELISPFLSRLMSTVAAANIVQSRVWVVCLWAFVGWCLELNDCCRNSKPIGWLWVFSKGRHLRVDESPRSRFGILWWSLWQFEGGDILHSMAFLFLVLNQKWLMLLCTIGFLEMIIVSELLWIMTKTWWFHEATTVFLQYIFELNLPISYSYVSRAHYFLLTASTVSHVWNYTASPKAIFWHLQVHLFLLLTSTASYLAAHELANNHPK